METEFRLGDLLIAENVGVIKVNPSGGAVGVARRLIDLGLANECI